MERSQLQENHAEDSRVMCYPAYEGAMQVAAKMHKAFISSFTYEQVVLDYHKCDECMDTTGMNSLDFFADWCKFQNINKDELLTSVLTVRTVDN